MHLARAAQIECLKNINLMDPLSLFLHASDAVRKGYKKLSVRTVDTDVVILVISTFSEINPDELWLSFGTGSNFRYISMKLLLKCILEFVLLSQCFMHLQDAILSQHFVAKARRCT